MSKEIKLLKVKSCNKHPDADTLYVVELWQGTAVTVDQFVAGEMAVYMPAGARPPEWLTEALGITKYLDHGKVKSVKLRNIQSKGALYSVEHIKKVALASKKLFNYMGNSEYDRFIDEKILGGVPVAPKKKVFHSKFSVQIDEEIECQS